MKKVRFESPLKNHNISMDVEECHSPRPFTENNNKLLIIKQGYQASIGQFEDPIEKYDTSNSSPLWPALQTKACVKSSCAPSNELDLSMFDATDRRTPLNPGYISTYKYTSPSSELNYYLQQNVRDSNVTAKSNFNYHHKAHNKNDSFFIQPRNSLDSVNLYQVGNVVNSHDNVLRQKQNFSRSNYCDKTSKVNYCQNVAPCYTNHGNNVNEKENRSSLANIHCNNNCNTPCVDTCSEKHKPCDCHVSPMTTPTSCPYPHCPCGVEITQQTNKCKLQCNSDDYKTHMTNNNDNKTPIIKNAVDKKTWCVEKFERSKKGQDTNMHNDIDSIKVDSEPTVSDLIKIIKLQNEQIKLLQEKVDKVISNTEQNALPSVPIEYRTEQVQVQTVDNNHHKISIGVMTSFEMVRTSAFINNECSKNQNAQVQCNTSKILIKEVLSKTKPVIEEQFLKGIVPVDNVQVTNVNVVLDDKMNYTRNTCNEDKTVNDLSLCNLIIDNPITPQLSPDQSIYLDVRDYSDSDDDNTAVGWTYYNKVMSHVNGMLQDSDIPTTAAAMQHKAEKNLQIQIDRSNVSITKRVTFGEDTIRMHHPEVAATSTDTSMRMNQLAQKYLKHIPPQTAPQVYPVNKPHPTVDMSFATRNYMERHQLLHAEHHVTSRPPSIPIPKFLDITALKKQPKLL